MPTNGLALRSRRWNAMQSANTRYTRLATKLVSIPSHIVELWPFRCKKQECKATHGIMHAVYAVLAQCSMQSSAQTLCGISSRVLADILTPLKFFGERTGDCASQKTSLQLRVLRLGFFEDGDFGVFREAAFALAVFHLNGVSLRGYPQGIGVQNAI